MTSTATKPKSISPPRSFIAPILTRNDSHQRLDLCRRCLRGIEFLSRTQRLVSRSSSTGARAKREPLTSTATSPAPSRPTGPARAARRVSSPIFNLGTLGRNDTSATPMSDLFRGESLRTSLSSKFRLARTVEGDRVTNERLEGGLVNFCSFVDVDRAACVSVETRVEETGRILQRRALGEGKLHDILVGFASADDAVVRPNRSAHPLPLLDDVRVCFLDELAHSAEVSPRQSPSSAILFEMSSDA